jgi:hypothetical protein
MEKHGWFVNGQDRFSYYYHKNELLISLQNYDTNNYLTRFTIKGCASCRIKFQANARFDAQVIAIESYKIQLNKLIQQLPS